jgi:spore coat polysaccharide biosynthesis protein SpsF
MHEKARIILQARMSSTRCPGKVLADICGRPLLGHCIARLEAARVGPVVVATSTEAEDDVVANLALRLGVAVCRGPLDDVLARFELAVRDCPESFLIRATGDNPAVDIDAPGRVLQRLEAGADYVGETGSPYGGAVEGVRAGVLRRAARYATDPYDREHVTPWVRSRSEEFAVVMSPVPAALNRPDLRFTVDTLDDLDYMRRVFTEARGERYPPSMAALIAAADRLTGGAGGGR